MRVFTSKLCEFCKRPMPGRARIAVKYCNVCSPTRRAIAAQHFGTDQPGRLVDIGGGYVKWVRDEPPSSEK